MDVDEVSIVQAFLEECAEDDFNYIMDVLMDCQDKLATVNCQNLFVYALKRAFKLDKDRLYETEEYELELEDSTTKEKVTIKCERPKSLAPRFIKKALSLLNTRIARSWNKFEYFVDIFLQLAIESEEALEYFFHIHLVKYLCDFILGKKSPMIKEGENRTTMGSSWNSPNFSALI